MSGRGLLFVLAVGSAHCAAARAPERLAIEAGPARAVGAPTFDRILSAFTAESQPIILLTPRLLEARFDGDDDEAGFSELVAHFEREGMKAEQASALLNWGAVLWFLGRGERAYSRLSRALVLFTEARAMNGLAHAHEWMGYVMRESGEDQIALDHLAVAFQLFRLMGQSEDAERVAQYGE